MKTRKTSCGTNSCGNVIDLSVPFLADTVPGATTLGVMTFSLTTVSITTFSITTLRIT